MKIPLLTVASLLAAGVAFAQPTTTTKPADSTGHAVRLAAEPFPLSQVRLLDGPFREAMIRDEDYLLSLDCDRLLYTFRVNAKLSK